jgi:hypothetical protein
MIFNTTLFLAALFLATSVNAIENIEFNIGGLTIGDKLTGEFSDKYCPKRNKEKKEIECKRVLDIDRIKINVLYLFYESSLVAVSFSYDAQLYRDLVKAYSKKLSHNPHESIEEPINLRTGVEYTNKKKLWHTASGDFFIENYGNNFTRGHAHIHSHEYFKYRSDKKDQINEGEIKKLLGKIFG